MKSQPFVIKCDEAVSKAMLYAKLCSHELNWDKKRYFEATQFQLCRK